MLVGTKKVFINNFPSIFSINCDMLPCPCWSKLSPQHDAAITMFHPGNRVFMGMCSVSFLSHLFLLLLFHLNTILFNNFPTWTQDPRLLTNAVLPQPVSLFLSRLEYSYFEVSVIYSKFWVFYNSFLETSSLLCSLVFIMLIVL